MRIDVYNLDFIDGTLRAVLKDAEALLEAETGEECTITSLHRIGDTGNHGQLPLRAVDLRCRDERIGNKVAGLINARWQYDPNRKWLSCAVFHDVGSGYHLHLQVHPSTASTGR